MKNLISFKANLLIIVGLLLSGCAGVQNVKSDYRLDTSSNKGLVIGTLTLKNKTLEVPYFSFKSENGDPVGSISFRQNLLTQRPETDLKDRFAKVFVIELPAGKYHFNQLVFPRHAGALNLSSSTIQMASFKVEAGKANYIGDIVIDAETSAIRASTVNSIKVRDLLEEDKNEFLKLYSNSSEIVIKKSITLIGD